MLVQGRVRTVIIRICRTGRSRGESPSSGTAPTRPWAALLGSADEWTPVTRLTIDRCGGRASTGSRLDRSGGDDLTPAEEFGAQLRRERERAGVTLDTIARVTNVTSTHFVGLERGDCSLWPPSIYSRAFLRGYARAIGLHPEQVLAEAEQYFPNFIDDSQSPPSRRGDARHELRLQLDGHGAQGPWVLRRAGVLAIDGTLAVLAGVGTNWAGLSFWIGATIVLAFCYAVAVFRGTRPPRSAFILPRAVPTAQRAPLPLESLQEPFPEDALKAEPSAPA